MIKPLIQRIAKKRSRTPAESTKQNQLAQAIALLQKWLICRLSTLEQKMTLFEKKMWFVFFCILMTTLGSYFIYQGISGANRNNSAYLQHQTIQPPVPVLPHDTTKTNLFQRLSEIKKQIDSSHK
jgi:hypothetical protein